MGYVMVKLKQIENHKDSNAHIKEKCKPKTDKKENNKKITSIYEFLVKNSLDGELIKNDRGGYDFISS